MDESESKNEKQKEERRFRPEQYDILKRCSDKRDVTEWNEWRKQNPNKDILLEQADLGGAHLERANMYKAHLKEATFTRAILNQTSFNEAQLEGAQLFEAHLQQAELFGTNLEGADLSNADLKGAQLEGVNLKDSVLRGANLENAVLSNSHAEGSNFESANLIGAKFGLAHLEGVNFRAAHLGAAKLKQAHLEGSNFYEAHMEYAIFKGAYMQDACLYGVHAENIELVGAHLEGVTLRHAYLNASNLDNAHLTGAKFDRTQLKGASLCFTNLRGARFNEAHLENAKFGWAVVDGSTLFRKCRLDEHTDFHGVGLEGCRIDSGTKQLLQYNIRRTNWEDWYKEHRWLKWLVKTFWWTSDYGRSTGRIVMTFFTLAVVFALVYWLAPGFVMVKDMVGNIRGFWHALYFSVVTMTTLGFGDIAANPDSWCGQTLLMLQVILGYVLLGALITRFAVLFTAGGPAGKFGD